jgi:hypothetical protein
MIKRSATVKVTAIRRRRVKDLGDTLRARCRLCGHEVELLTTMQAARILEADTEALARLIADHRVHVIRTVNGSLLICKDSLFQQEEREK